MHLYQLIWHWWMSLFTIQRNGEFIHSFIKRYYSRKFCSTDVETFMHRQSGCFFRLMKLPLQNLGERNFVGISFVLLVISRVCCVSGWPLVLCFGIKLYPLPPTFYLKLVGTFLLIVTVCCFKTWNCLLLNHQISLNLIQLVIQCDISLWLEFGSFAVQIRTMKYRTLKEGILSYVYGSVHHNIFYEITNRCSYMQSILFHC